MKMGGHFQEMTGKCQESVCCHKHSLYVHHHASYSGKFLLSFIFVTESPNTEN